MPSQVSAVTVDEDGEELDDCEPDSVREGREDEFSLKSLKEELDALSKALDDEVNQSKLLIRKARRIPVSYPETSRTPPHSSSKTRIPPSTDPNRTCTSETSPMLGRYRQPSGEPTPVNTPLEARFPFTPGDDDYLMTGENPLFMRAGDSIDGPAYSDTFLPPVNTPDRAAAKQSHSGPKQSARETPKGTPTRTSSGEKERNPSWMSMLETMRDTLERQEVRIRRLERENEALHSELLRRKKQQDHVGYSGGKLVGREYRTPPPSHRYGGVRGGESSDNQQSVFTTPLSDHDYHHQLANREVFSPGTQFVAELSKVMQLDEGHHALLSLIMDKHYGRVSQIWSRHGWDR